MIEAGFESRVKVQQIIDSQLPEFILDERPKASEFLKQYYISQEYQGGNIDIVENLDQYLKLDNLTPEVIVGNVVLSDDISSSSSSIFVSTTKGFPQKYGLLKIDDEIITYSGITTNSFTGCIRGFSGITNYHSDLNSEELVFSTSSASSHNKSTVVQNLSVLFLQEFYKKIKFSLTPGLENINFTESLNVGNFIKEAKTLYQSKGTNESFRILFNVLFGETPKIIDLENYLIKPSSATYLRREIVIVEAISGNPSNLSGQTIFKNNDPKTTASVSEVEIIQRKGKTYYKLLLFVGYDDAFPTITGTFNITGSTRNINYVAPGSSTIIVDSTIGFPKSGKIYSGDNVITYTDKSVNQFFGCSGINVGISTASIIRSDETYYGYENGDLSKKVEFRLTGVLSNYKSISEQSIFSVGEKIGVKNVGELIGNPINDPSYKEIFANSWIYNTSSRYEIDSFSSGSTSQFTLKSNIDKSSLKVGDFVDILFRDSNNIVYSNLQVTQIVGNQVTTNTSFILNTSSNYDIRRKINTAKSSFIPLDNDSLFADVQNVYNENDEFIYVAANSLPSYTITNKIFSYNASGVGGKNISTNLYSSISFSSKVSFVTGDEIYYKPSQSPIPGLSEGVYYVEVLSGETSIRLYASRSVTSSLNYLYFGELTQGTHNFTLNIQKENVISSQKILRKFPLKNSIKNAESDLTLPGSIGMLINGVEVINYKSDNKVYYGPLENVKVLNGGKDFDVIRPPFLSLSTGSALLQPVVSGSVEKIYVEPQDFDIDVFVSVSITGGNGKGCSFEPIIERKRREIEFDARELGSGGGVDIQNETITFSSSHGLIDGQPIIYRSGNNSPLGIGTFGGNNFNTGQTLKTESTYYAKYISDTTIQLYQSFANYVSGINTVGFTTAGTSGIHKFVTDPKNTLTAIKVLNGGEGYTNRKLRVSPSGISTVNYTISYENHGFNTGELVTYEYETSGITGLSTSNQYYVIKIDNGAFRLADAGIGGTNTSNYERGNYIKFQNSGTGYQIFNYPEINLSVEYTSVGLRTDQIRGSIKATPVVKGKITDVYVYESGTDYGSTILNYHKKPSINIKNGKDGQLKPIIINGRIEDVTIQYGGTEYYSTPELKVIGSGTGALLKAVIVNNKISDVIVVNTGVGYSSDTTIVVESSGKNAVFDPNVRSISVNNNILYKDINSTTFTANEIVKSSYNNLQYGICGYFGLLQTIFGDNSSTHSPIIGWAYDGNPIYGSYGYSDPKNRNSSIKKLTSGYELSTANINNRPSGFSDGFFIDDYKYTNSGDLDEHNGRYCVTPEFPNGVYAYFATTIVDSNGNIVGSFPYFVGNKFRSKFISENKTLNQDFDFNESQLIRNTFPYKVADKYADNDFISESNEIINQITNIESVTSGSIESFDIINVGNNYNVRDKINFDESNTDGGGLIAEISEVKGKNILTLETTTNSYNNSIFTWNSGEKIKITVSPNHNLQNLNYVSISGFSTQNSYLNGFYQIGVTTYSSTLEQSISNYSTTGIVTDIYLTNIPNSISIGSSIKVESETLRVLNIFRNQNIVRIKRETTGAAHTATTPVYFLPDSFTIDKKSEYFESEVNDLVYFNPKESVGVGTTSGSQITKNYKIGNQIANVSIPIQSIYLPNHKFKNNQEVTLVKPSSASNFSVSNSSGGSVFSLPSSGNSQKVYVIRQSEDYVGIVTQIGLTTTSNGLFFTSDGSNDYEYYFTTNFNQLTGKVDSITSRIVLDEEHGLLDNDKVTLKVEPNLSVGIGTSSYVSLKYNSQRNLLIVNPVGFNSTGINTTSSEISISNHNFKTGDKVAYGSTLPAVGLATGVYYIYKVNDNTIKLCETYNDSISNPPLTVNITGKGISTHELGLINPPISFIKGNNVVFNLTDSSLVGYSLQIFTDENFEDEFISTGSTSGFSIIKSGTVGVTSDASLVINYDSKIPVNLFYNLEKFGSTLNVDKDVKNYSKISFVDSYYNGTYIVSGVGSTTFNISLPIIPESNLYSKDQCSSLEYTTKSNTALGSISNIRIISPGSGFKSLPIFNSIDSKFGSGAYLTPKSSTIGKINQIRISNEGFEYSSDKTLSPEALIPTFLDIKDSNTISKINILDGGKNYTSSPDLIIINSETGNKINSGLLVANIVGSSIGSVSVIENPKGLPKSNINIIAINNTNGVGIQTVQSSSSGIVTCTLITPLFGFSVEPFDVGDKIFVEGILKDGTSGDGLNSEDYGYQFFTVSEYLNSGTTNPRILKFNISELTNNPGIAASTQDFGAKVINYKNYPKFTSEQIPSDFTIGELIDIDSGQGFSQTELRITEFNDYYIKVSGFYDLKTNQVIRGTQSGSLATINAVKSTSGIFNIGYSSKTTIGWLDNIGKLNDDYQVIPNNDYYQNLSYSVKSSKGWEEIVSPVNNLLHTAGLKNFADTEIINNVGSGSTTVKEYTTIIHDILNENRVDTINNFDLTIDVDTLDNNSSRFLKLKNKKISDYIECRTNRVLEIDDISSQFSNFNQEIDKKTRITNIVPSKKYERYLIQVSNLDYSQVQFSEIVVLVNNNDIFTLEKATLTNTDNLVSDIYGYKDENTNDTYLALEPTDPNNFTYDIKYVNNSFSNFNSGIGTTSVGFINLTSKTSSVLSTQNTTLFEYPISNTKSVYSEIHLVDNTTNEMNYVEIFVDHDGVNTNMSEFYFDTNEDPLSSNFIGSFTSSITSGILKLNYNNTTGNSVTVRSRNVGFGSTSVGIGTYRFKSPGQPDGSERTVVYNSTYSNVSTASTILTVDPYLIKSVKSTIRVSTGQTTALHQVMLIGDNSKTHTLQYPFLSIGSTSGIGTFGGETNGSITSLKFYPDQSISGNFEITSFNQIFYSENDYINSPSNLEYGNTIELVGVSKFFGKNTDELNKTSFDLTYNGTPIFTKTFDPSNSTVLNLSTGEFNISNHFFNTGEELIYTPNSTFSTISPVAVGIGSTLNNVGVVTNILPSTVYAIRIDNSKFKIATRKEYALANPAISVTFTSYGAGNAHQLEMRKKNEKCIISIDNLTQSPLSYTGINYTIDNGSQLGTATTIFGISGISSITPNDILKIDNEYMKVIRVGLGTTYSGPISFEGSQKLVNVERAFVGSSATTHSNSSNISIYKGSFNIVKNQINFTNAPMGGLSDQLFGDLDNLKDPRSYFNGRVFLKKNYDDNKIFDDVSKKFTGIGQTYTLTVSGLNTIGVGSEGSNGIVFINGIFQTPTTQNNLGNNFSIVEDISSGISSVVFTGITSSNGSVIISESDINLNQLPRGGLIVSLGSTNGLGYAPLVGASVTAVVGAGGSIISIGIGSTGNWGSGYRNPVSIAITESTHTGLAATITAVVGAGGTLSFSIVGGGTGYTNPIISISPPNYANLPVVGVSRLGIGNTTETGVGLLLNIDVGPISTTGIGSTLFEVTGFKISRSGYGFKIGDVIKPVGLVTAYGLSSVISDFQLTVLDTFTDSFSAWQFGELDYIDSIKSYQDGLRTRFPLFYKSQLLSFERNSLDLDSQLIEFDSLLLIFINGILQQPKVAYQFDGGTSFTFTQAPKAEDNVSIFFYRGSSNDSQSVKVNESIKIGDDVQVLSNNNNLQITETQGVRNVIDISSSDKIETNLYSGKGVDTQNFKPFNWTKQKKDKIVNGTIVSKSRKSIEPQIYPTCKIIKSINSSDTQIFVDDAKFFDYEGASPIDFDLLIVDNQSNQVSASVTAVVSISGTIQSLIVNNVGSGYTGSSVEVKIAAPKKIGVGIGTTATATIAVVNGSLSGTISITNPGFGYTNTNPPQVIISLPKPKYEIVKNASIVQGFSGIITGISTSAGIGTNLAITFRLSSSAPSFSELSVGYPIYIYDTKVGSGVTSIINNDQSIVGVGTYFLDNIYHISAFNSTLGIITCNVRSNSSIIGISTTGSNLGKFSWGRISGFSRSNNPISIGLSGYTINSGLSSFPTAQRRGYGFNDNGAIVSES